MQDGLSIVRRKPSSVALADCCPWVPSRSTSRPRTASSAEAHGALAHAAEDLVAKPVLVLEDEVFLGAEVREQRLDRGVGRVGNLGHGDVVEPALREHRLGGAERLFAAADAHGAALAADERTIR